ncbi:HEAT repeat domain-containing protein [Lutibacter flavus]|uniref:HEAT repeat-containing protein n=1 Tax=Lutibacter flavus TaxID=691689 RepID=A0A238YN23_9FLAO|nr:HEAT repeat domain-containing protein [Lutibacter flavus]SNR72656.1 hypothetical protein SAMN04488111_2682 [Lutibacter flavus]
MNEFEYLIDNFKQLPVLIKIVWILSGILGVIIINLVIYLKYLRGYLRNKEKIFAKFQSEYEGELINYLYASEEEDATKLKIVKKMKTCIKDKFKRKIFLTVLSKLKNDISGEMADSIQHLYVESGLIDYSLAKLKSSKWDVKAVGIKELALFEITNVYSEISKYKDYPKQEVRNEVQLYFVNLFQFKGLDFLNDLITPISEWNQIQLLEILQKFDDQQITDISPWLKSENKSVVMFALKLAKIYNQFQVINILLELLAHENKDIRVEAIKVLSYFQANEAKQILKNNFINSSIDEQIAFFNMLEGIVETSDEDFILENVSHENFEIKTLALKLLKFINTDRFNSLSLVASDVESKAIFNYLEDN